CGHRNARLLIRGDFLSARAMNVVQEIQRINERELEAGLSGDASWHAKYKDSAWVFVGGLVTTLTEGDVLCVMSQWGEIEDINLVRDKATGKSKGFAFLKYEDQRSTILAVDNFNGIKLLDRTLRVDHCERYRLPKELKDKEEAEEEEKIAEWRPGHAYEGKALASDLSVTKGVDLFAVLPPSHPPAPQASSNGSEEEDNAQRARKKHKRHKKEEKRGKHHKKKHKREKKEWRDGGKDDNDDESDGEFHNGGGGGGEPEGREGGSGAIQEEWRRDVGGTLAAARAAAAADEAAPLDLGTARRPVNTGPVADWRGTLFGGRGGGRGGMGSGGRGGGSGSGGGGGGRGGGGDRRGGNGK
ncbi:unnamed protein product, partial [Phaeothamnion confervicola]